MVPQRSCHDELRTEGRIFVNNVFTHGSIGVGENTQSERHDPGQWNGLRQVGEVGVVGVLANFPFGCWAHRAVA